MPFHYILERKPGPPGTTQYRVSAIDSDNRATVINFLMNRAVNDGFTLVEQYETSAGVMEALRRYLDLDRTR